MEDEKEKPLGATPSDTSLAEEEPKLSYERVLNDLARILRTDSITCSCLHSKFFAIGTLYGRVHIFDHLGNKVDRQDIHLSLKPVNCISIDDKGEYLVGCSDDRLAVTGFCNKEHSFATMTDKPVNVVAIDPSFHKPGIGRRFVTGDDRVVLYERGLLGRYKTTLIQAKEQKVRRISWFGQFIAWATDLSVQIWDVEQRTIITRIKRDSELELYHSTDQCQFCWKDKKTLLIGWSNSVKVCVIKERSHEVLSTTQLRELPRKYVEIISMFETDFTLCGLAPFKNNLLTLSIDYSNSLLRRLSIDDAQNSCSTSMVSNQSSTISTDATHSTTSSGDRDNESLNSTATTATMRDELVRPQVHILETFPDTYNELSKDVLTPNGCLTGLGTNKKLAKSNLKDDFPYKLLDLHSEGTYFIVCPKDVISAKPRDYDDHIDWLIQLSQLKECCNFAREFSSELVRHSVKEVEQLYRDHLFEKRTAESYREAGEITASICGSDQKAWDSAIEQFQDLNQLNQLLPYLPRKLNGFHLNRDSFNLVLGQFLAEDSVSFFRAIKEIPSQLYSLEEITDNVIRCLASDPKNLVLNEALAELYTRLGRFEDAVNIYLDCNDKTRVFSLIRENGLVSILRDKVDRLMQIDADETSQLLVENINSIPMKEVVERLQRYRWEKFLVTYLHRVVQRDIDSCMEYHDLMVKLYAQHQQESLLNFLKLSTNYRLEEALETCKEANLIKEVVFLLSRMGDLRIALRYITESQGDINEGIEFCKEHQDSELWQDLISYSIDKPEFIGALLKNIGTHISDPIELIDKIPIGCEIEGLMPALVKILQDYQLQISLEQSCRDLVAKDCFTLLEKQVRCQTQGIAIREDQLCSHCNQPLLTESSLGDDISQTRSIGSLEAQSAVVGPSSRGASDGRKSTANSSNDLVVFGCHHVFHEECCADAAVMDSDLATTKILTCRVCMLEDGLS